MIVTAKVIAHAFDSKNAIQYFPGDVVELDLANPHQRKMVWLKTPRGRWIFEFDRANSSDTDINMFFCKDCGEPFEKLNQLGTHNRQFHNNDKIKQAEVQAENDEAEERRLRAEHKAAAKSQAEKNEEMKAKRLMELNDYQTSHPDPVTTGA